jgi:hypothetical protein
MKIRARCTDGPYAGQIFEFYVPREKIHYGRPALPYEPVGPLVWIINGSDRHAYSLASNRYGWRLIYRDTF